MAQSESGSDNEIDEVAHKKLLSSIHLLDSKQRIKPSTRTEPSREVSEFDLGDVKGGGVTLKDLAKTLERHGKKYNVDVARKAKGLIRSQALPKPLEKNVADKVKRVVGYENLKQSASRWVSVVEANKAARTLTFPLNEESFSLMSSDELLAGWRAQTSNPLEAQIREILDGKKEAEDEKKKEEEKYQLTLEELRELRKEQAKLRAQQSYHEAKARRVKRIKSKSYHRVQRRAKMQQELKNFENLKKTDPEAALEELEKFEKMRALERMTLRHRNSGKWATGRMIRAKYDKQARQELAEQLAISRDLTKKVKMVDSSDDETETNVVAVKKMADAENPWMNDMQTSSEVVDFVSGYRKYWEEKNKEEETSGTTKMNGVSSHVPMKTKETLKNVESSESKTKNKTNTNEKNELPHSDFKELSKSIVTKSPVDSNCSVISNKANVSQISKDQQSKQKNQNHHDINNGVGTEEKASSISQKSSQTKKHSEKKRVSILDKSNDDFSKQSVHQSPVSQTSGNLNNSKKETVKSSPKSSSKSVELAKKTKTSKIMKNENVLVGTSKEWTVTSVDLSTKRPISVETVKEDQPKKKRKRLTRMEKMFDEAQIKLKEKLENKLSKLKKYTKEINDNKENEKENLMSDEEEGPSLAMKKPIERPILDEGLLEGTMESEEATEKLKSLTNTAKREPRTEKKVSDGQKDIDPNNFIKATPKVLLTSVPDVISAGDEALDNEPQTQHCTIAEAFADDDVVDDFRKEKAEIVAEAQPKDIDLFMPGWGSWGGSGIELSKRKRRRFLIKAPKAPPRKDDRMDKVIIYEDKSRKIREHQVTELPYPFRRVEDFEASIRYPIGRTWVPETAHRKLIEPKVKTKIGKIIQPMDESVLLENSKVRTM